jgi:hypothetical protein
MRTVAAVLALVLLSLPGCNDPEEPSPADARPLDRDAVAGCVPSADLEVGRCLLGDQSPCTSPDDATASFSSLDGSSTTVAMVVGFQGATMFSLALRARNIEPGVDGQPEGDPLIDVSLFNPDEIQVANYFRRVRFEAVAGSSGTYEMRYVFLLVAGATDTLVGQVLTARASVSDRTGAVICGTGSFVAAGL